MQDSFVTVCPSISRLIDMIADNHHFFISDVVDACSVLIFVFTVVLQKWNLYVKPVM